MSRYQKRARPRNYFRPDLFDWLRERDLHYANRAARRIAKRYGLSLHHAKTIATLAGIGPEAVR
jgi:hypothetical protein